MNLIITDELNLEDGEEIKLIDGETDYYITSFGNVYSYKKGKWRKLSPYVGSKKKYLLINFNHKSKLVHRLVTIAFIPNPNNLPEVNHKDKNIHNPKASNLEWCTRKENLNDSYSTMSPVRHFNTCELFKAGKKMGNFQSISKACRYASKYFNASQSSLSKYLKWDDIEIVPSKKTGKYQYENHTCTKTQNKSTVKLYKNGYFQKEFNNFSELAKYYKDEFGIDMTPACYRNRFYRKQIVDGYEIRKISKTCND